MTFFTATAR